MIGNFPTVLNFNMLFLKLNMLSIWLGMVSTHIISYVYKYDSLTLRYSNNCYNHFDTHGHVLRHHKWVSNIDIHIFTCIPVQPVFGEIFGDNGLKS